MKSTRLATVDLLPEGIDREDVIEFSGHYWAMRNEKYAFGVDDHWVWQVTHRRVVED